MEVIHCICTDTVLATLANGAYPSLAAVMVATQCGAYCGLCLPWIAKVCRVEV